MFSGNRLTPEQEKFALECIQSGRCQSIHDLLDFASQLLEEYESKTPTEKFALFLSRLPYVSDEEQKDIEEHRQFKLKGASAYSLPITKIDIKT